MPTLFRRRTSRWPSIKEFLQIAFMGALTVASLLGVVFMFAYSFIEGN